LGDIKVNRYFPWITYCPEDYMVEAPQIRQAICLLQPGDIVLRYQDDYIIDHMIPGKYSHSGLYIGNGTIIHSISEGVQTIDIMDFLRCDAFIILRLAYLNKEAVDRAREWIGKGYDHDFKSGNDKFYCHELVAEAYAPIGYIDIHIEKIEVDCFGMEIGKEAYTSDSFMDNLYMKTIMEYTIEEAKAKRHSQNIRKKRKSKSLSGVTLVTSYYEGLGEYCGK
jgi:hypothetical protein